MSDGGEGGGSATSVLRFWRGRNWEQDTLQENILIQSEAAGVIHRRGGLRKPLSEVTLGVREGVVMCLGGGEALGKAQVWGAHTGSCPQGFGGGCRAAPRCALPGGLP